MLAAQFPGACDWRDVLRFPAARQGWGVGLGAAVKLPAPLRKPVGRVNNWLADRVVGLGQLQTRLGCHVGRLLIQDSTVAGRPPYWPVSARLTSCL